MYIEEQAVAEIFRRCNRVQGLLNDVEEKVNVEMINIWAKRETKKKLQQIRDECYMVLQSFSDYPDY